MLRELLAILRGVCRVPSGPLVGSGRPGRLSDAVLRIPWRMRSTYARLLRKSRPKVSAALLLLRCRASHRRFSSETRLMVPPPQRKRPSGQVLPLPGEPALAGLRFLLIVAFF